MNKKLLLMTAIASLAFTASAVAQRPGRKFEKGVTSIIGNEKSDSVADVENAFKINGPSTPRDNNLPRFAIVGKEGKFYLGLGAQFLGEATFDWGDHMPSTLKFIPSSMTPRTPGNGANLGFAWQSSSIHMNFIAMPSSKNRVGLYFKGDFNPQGGFKASHFYARYRGLTVGYTKGAFTDGATQPYTIDNQGPNGFPTITLFTAYWVQKYSHGLSSAIGIDFPNVSLTNSDYTSQVNQRIPAIPLNVQYAYNGGSDHIRLSGLIRPMQYRNLRKGHNSTLTGLGVQLSGITEIYGPLSFSYNATYGRGIANYIQDNTGKGLDATPSTTEGKLSMTRTLGLTAGLSLDFHKVSTNLVYSHVTNWLGNNTVAQPDMYRYGDYVAANVVYNVNRFLSMGIEYDYGHTHSFAGTPLHSNRLQVQMALTF